MQFPCVRSKPATFGSARGCARIGGAIISRDAENPQGNSHTNIVIRDAAPDDALRLPIFGTITSATPW